jgi:hypothetical protein
MAQGLLMDVGKNLQMEAEHMSYTKRWPGITLAILTVLTLGLTPALAADTTKVDAATKQVETGAKKIGDGKIGEGVEETAKGIGNTVVEGAKLTGEKLKEAGKAAEPPAKSAWEKAKDGAGSFGTSVKNFFSKLFSN